DALDLDIDALADLAAITGAGGEQLVGLFGGVSFDAPLLGARDVDGGVVGLQRGPVFGPLFESGNSHGLLRDESPVEGSLARPAGENKSATQFWHGEKCLLCGGGTGQR